MKKINISKADNKETFRLKTFWILQKMHTEIKSICLRINLGIRRWKDIQWMQLKKKLNLIKVLIKIGDIVIGKGNERRAIEIDRRIKKYVEL